MWVPIYAPQRKEGAISEAGKMDSERRVRRMMMMRVTQVSSSHVPNRLYCYLAWALLV